MDKKYIMIETSDMEEISSVLRNLCFRVEKMAAYFTGRSIIDPNDTDWEKNEVKGMELGSEIHDDIWRIRTILEENYYCDEDIKEPFDECLISEKELERLSNIEET